MMLLSGNSAGYLRIKAITPYAPSLRITGFHAAGPPRLISNRLIMMSVPSSSISVHAFVAAWARRVRGLASAILATKGSTAVHCRRDSRASAEETPAPTRDAYICKRHIRAASPRVVLGSSCGPQEADYPSWGSARAGSRAPRRDTSRPQTGERGGKRDWFGRDSPSPLRSPPHTRVWKEKCNVSRYAVGRLQ